MAKIEETKLTNFIPDQNNANKGTIRGQKMIEESVQEDGAARSIVVDRNGNVAAGNKTLEAAVNIGLEKAIVVETSGNELVVVKRNDWDLTDDNGAARRYAYRDNRSGELSLDWNPEQVLADLDAGVDLSGLFDEDELGALLDGVGVDLESDGEDTEPEIDRADELRQEWGVELGQLWQLGPHRVICGDCTDGATVERLMGEERAVLLHADPPYGMGKEKDGIANDNLYRDKLDSFQLQWWDACRGSLEDNGSVYIWGNAEDLWRLWYVGGLRDRERMTFRNQVIWDKPPSGLGDGQNNSIMRSYGIKYETLIFFMLGEQGFNNNADNYWDGWEPIRAYLKSERDKMGWDNKKVAEMFGFHPRMASHWFDESQWSFIKEGQYAKLQNAANNEAFKRDYEALRRDYDELKRDYDELKRDFYATRAYFDNTHDLMTDVWQFPRVKGPERWGHATPKPVPMIERIINTSAPKDTAILSPFLGSGTDLIAAHNLNRTCYGSEIDPGYTAVILQRFLDHTNIKPELIST